MEKLITVADVKERYGCSRQTARKYIRECKPHMEKPLTTTERAFTEWEANRVAFEEKSITYRMIQDAVDQLKGKRVIVPRRR
jgi:hypothetical protein